MSEKIVYICDGCRKEIKKQTLAGYSEDGFVMLKTEKEPYTAYDNIHICSDCLQRLYNLQQAGCEINFLE